jgi:hypothetical protein
MLHNFRFCLLGTGLVLLAACDRALGLQSLFAIVRADQRVITCPSLITGRTAVRPDQRA